MTPAEGPRLLIRLGSLGDVVLATAAARAWKENLGINPLDVLVKEEWAPLWEGHPDVRRVWRWGREERGLKGIADWSRRVRGEGYVETADLQGTVRTRLLTRLGGLVGVRRPARYGARRRALARWKRWGPPAGYRVARSFVDTVAPGRPAEPVLFPGKEARARAAELLPREGGLALVPGARHATKRWPAERFVEVGKRAAREGWGPVAVLWGPGDEALEARFAGEWPEAGEWVSVRDALPVAAAVLDRCAAAVTNDTGLMHVAAAMGTGVVALFGPTVREFGFEPAGAGHLVVERDLPCRPCSVHGGPRCPLKHFRCMLDVGSDVIWKAVSDLLTDRVGRRRPSFGNRTD